LAFASLFALAAAISAAACGGSSSSEAGHSHGGSAASGTGAEAGAGDVGNGTGGSGASSSTGGSAGHGGSTNGSGGSINPNGGSSADAAGGASDTSAGAPSTGGTDATSGGTSGTAGTAGTAGAPAFGTTQCNDGIDNDGDGLIDGMDPECSGPWDNDESSFATGIPGDNKDPKWQDCFFDGNSGAGDDGCRYATGCLTGDLPQSDPSCTLSQMCLDYCAPRAPNGCDCFGCCTIQTPDGSSVDIFEVSTCSIANIDDTKACPRCVKNTQCQNTCGECELCPGKTVADLPASCTPTTTGSGGTSGTGGSSDTGGTSGTGGSSDTGGTSGTGGTPGSGGTDTNPPPPPPSYTCNGGEQVCGPGLAACPTGFYCELGCCLVVVR
jgi:hypothetical protein